MCGIIGYTGSTPAVKKIEDGLKALEYRGYDSVGIAAFSDSGIRVIKSKGRIDAIAPRIEKDLSISGAVCGMGHTRWATHGEPSDINAHPHGTRSLMLVHNGIIENYMSIKEMLENNGEIFLSDTDTEVAARLIDRKYDECKDPIKAISEAVKMLKGSFAFCIMFNDIENTIFALRKDSPLILAFADDGYYVASDLPAVLKHTRKYMHLEEGHIAILNPDGCNIYDGSGNDVPITVQEAEFDISSSEKNGYPHFMLKEIFEEPISVIRTVNRRIKNALPYFSDDGISDDILKKYSKIRIIACGSAMHAGMVGKNAIEKLARIPVYVEIASEFRYSNPILCNNELYVIISQSGETADSLAALRLIKQSGKDTLAIVNVEGSAIAREAKFVIYTHAGPEIAVATTKGYCVQVSAVALLAVKLAMLKGEISESFAKEICGMISYDIPEAINKTLKNEKKCEEIAEKIKSNRDIFYIGRGIDYSLCLESSLKLKEISYIHSEAYAAGELKHGTISLVTDGVPVIAIASEKELYEKTVSNIRECKARGAYTILICPKDFPVSGDIADDILYLPTSKYIAAQLCAVTYSQLIAYKTAVSLGRDVDKPRNLAKSVTVE